MMEVKDEIRKDLKNLNQKGYFLNNRLANKNQPIFLKFYYVTYAQDVYIGPNLTKIIFYEVCYNTVLKYILSLYIYLKLFIIFQYLV